MFLLPGAKLAQKVDVGTALQTSIASSHGESAAANLVPSCHAFQELRASLHEPPTTEPTRQGIKRYLTALNFLLTHVSPSIDIPLLWVHAFDADAHSSHSDLRIDLIAALFNLGVCEASLATLAYRYRRSDATAMRNSARHFQTSAGYFHAAADLPIPGGVRGVTTDLYPPALKALEMVMLGNAQQVFYEKTLESGTAPALLARFAVGAREFYQIAAESCCEPDVVNTCINAYVGRPAAALAAYFNVVAQSSQAAASRDAYDMPQQLARLSIAEKSLNVGLATATSLDTASLAAVAALKTGLLAKLEELRTSILERKVHAEEENRCVYFATPASHIPDIVSRQSVKSADVLSNLYNEFPLDERIVPFEELPEPIAPDVSAAASRYTDALAKYVAEEVANLNTSASHLREVLIQIETTIKSRRTIAETEASKSRPPQKISLKEDQEAINAIKHVQNAGSIRALSELQSQVVSLAAEVKGQIQSIENMLRQEDEEDRQLRVTVPNTTRAFSAMLTQQYVTKLSKLRTNLEQAANADLIVGGQIDLYADAILLLNDISVLDFIPPSASSQPPLHAKEAIDVVEEVALEVDPEITAGKELLLDKDDFVQELEKKKLLDNPNSVVSDLSGDTPEVDRFSAAIEAEYGDMKKEARETCSEMRRISEVLTKAVTRLLEPVQGEVKNDEGQARMNEIYKHQAAVLKFKELMGHLQQGAEFYSKEKDNIVMLKRDFEGFVAARTTEAQDIANQYQRKNEGNYLQQGGFYPSNQPPSWSGSPFYPASSQPAATDPSGAYNNQPPNARPSSAWRGHYSRR